MKKDLYQITNLETFNKGAPFALCEKHFHSWVAKDKVLWDKIGENTNLPCNQCGN